MLLPSYTGLWYMVPAGIQSTSPPWGLASLVAQTVENLPAVPETQLQSLFLVQEDPLEKGMVTHTSILAWEIP